MNSLEKNKKTLLLVVFLGLASFTFFMYLVFNLIGSLSTSKPEAEESERPSPQVEEINERDPQAREQEEAEPEKILEIIALRDKTPYYGRFFIFTFDENEGIFYFYIDPKNKTEGNREFDEFLRQNGIPDRSYFPFLEETSSPRPTPLNPAP